MKKLPRGCISSRYWEDLETGFVGTPYLLHALSDNGYAETAYDLLLRRLPQVRPSLGVRRIGPRQNCLPTIDLTIGTLQQQANENRRAEVVCSSGFSAFSRETIQEDAAFLTAEEAQVIEVVNDEQNKPCTFSAEDALKDIELLPRILRSSYGAYYLYEKADWDAAADSM